MDLDLSFDDLLRLEIDSLTRRKNLFCLAQELTQGKSIKCSTL